MKQILCLLLNNWPIERVRRKVPAARREPLVLVRSVANRQEIVAVCGDAFKRGMRIGMTLAQARALFADVNWLEHEPQRDAQSLEALGRWLMRFSPIVQPYQWNARHGIFLDLTGCERVFNGLDVLEAELVAALARLRITGNCAVAATMGAAWALAHRPCSRRACSPISAPSVESASRLAGYTKTANEPVATNPWSRRSCATPFGKQHPTLRGEKPGQIIAGFLGEMESSDTTKEAAGDKPSNPRERCDESHPTNAPLANEHTTVQSAALDLLPSPLYPGERDRGRGVLRELDYISDPEGAARTDPSPQHSPLSTREREDALCPLPVHTLRIDSESAELLHQLGITTIGQLLKLPRETLPARFGDGLLLRIDQALGHIVEPLLPLHFFTPISAKMEFEGPVDSLEAIFLIFKRLLVEVVAELQRRGEGAREIEASFKRPYALTLTKTIRLSNPSRDPKNLFNLLRCALEMLQTDVGFLGVKLKVTGSQRIAEEQIDLMEREQFVDAQELCKLIERLQIRLGQPVVAQPKLIESHLPEKRFKCESPDEKVKIASPRAKKKKRPSSPRTQEEGLQAPNCLSENRVANPLSLVLGGEGRGEGPALGGLSGSTAPSVFEEPLFLCPSPLSTGKREANAPILSSKDALLSFGQMRLTDGALLAPFIRSGSIALSDQPLAVSRPLHLFSPQPIQVTVNPYHAPDGKPAHFSWHGMLHTLQHVIGPERISGLWWENHLKTRDYFDVENESGCRYWIFHVHESRRWFVHGEFE